jgi:hypothetical protein
MQATSFGTVQGQRQFWLSFTLGAVEDDGPALSLPDDHVELVAALITGASEHFAAIGAARGHRPSILDHPVWKFVTAFSSMLFTARVCAARGSLSSDGSRM